MLDSLVLTAALALPADTDRQAALDRASRSAATAPSRWQAFARCVAERESGNSPTARNSSSSAAGVYQFLDNSWRRPLAYMVADRLKDYGYPKAQAKALRIQLQGKHIATWPARWQHVGFAAVISHPGGARHWYLAGSKCNALGGLR